jgi:hypothetical protein
MTTKTMVEHSKAHMRRASGPLQACKRIYSQSNVQLHMEVQQLFIGC